MKMVREFAVQSGALFFWGTGKNLWCTVRGGRQVDNNYWPTIARQANGIIAGGNNK